MTVFLKVKDKLCNSFLASNPDVYIYCPNGVLVLCTIERSVYLKWNLQTCIDAMDLISDHQDITFNVNYDEICYSEDSLDDFI